MKLYPPYIEGVIPAFTSNIIKIPFLHNTVVSAADIKTMIVLIKDLYNTQSFTVFASSFNIGSGILNCDVSSLNLDIGAYYKIQIAYVDNDDLIGYYSTIGISKYTTNPIVEIEGLAAGANNPLNSEYVGIFKQSEDADLTEKLYSSYFIIYNNQDQVIYKTDEKIHNSGEDTISNEQRELVNFNLVLEDNKEYKIQFCTKSINGVLFNSIKYNIVKNQNIAMDFVAILKAENDAEEGRVKLFLEQPSQKYISGLFLLSRIDADTNERIVIHRFRLNVYKLEDWEYFDYTVEQGHRYYYAIQQSNNYGLTSKEIRTEQAIYATFEYIFLTDGQKQLKIKYNPKVNNFKNTILEQKVDTLGSKYPFIYRNGNVRYKEFAIEGLLSYLSDDLGCFIDIEKDNSQRHKTDVNISSIATTSYKTNLTDDNYRRERDWKLNVLEWLNNGKVKLFRSAAEGNYLVRLINVSLTPEQKLGRLLHSFQATAYEMAEVNPSNLNLYNILNLNYNESDVKAWSSWVLDEMVWPEKNEPLVLNTVPIYGIKIADMRPGAIVEILFANAFSYEKILIGATGAYSLDNIEINSIRINEPQHQGIISYKHLVTASSFDKIINIKNYPTIGLTLFGNWQSLEERQGLDLSYLYFLQNNNKYRINKMNFIKFEKRDIVVIPAGASIPKDELNIYYQLSDDFGVGKFYIYNLKTDTFEEFSEEEFEKFENLYKIQYNNTEIDLTNMLDYIIKYFNTNESYNIKIGLGVKMDLSFSYQEIIYEFEEKYYKLQEAKKNFLDNPTQQAYENYINYFNTILAKEGVINV